MPPLESEQALEWTFQLRPGGMFILRCFLDQIIIGVPVGCLIALIAPPTTVILAIGLFGLALLILFALFGKRASRTLRISRQTITLTDAHAFGTKERQMFADGAKFYCVRLDFFERLFTFDMDRICSAYHIEIVQIGETFLFPCHDEKEQLQIAGKIKELGLS